MIRSLAGLTALLAVGLLMALSAATVQAAPTFEAGSYPAKVRGESFGMSIGTEGGPIKCQTTSFEGSLEKASAALSMSPFYGQCVVWVSGANYSVSSSGCKYVLDAMEKQSADQYKAQFGIACSSGAIVWSLSGISCAAEFPSQEGLANIQIADDTGAPNRITATFEVAGLAYTVTKDGFLCPFKGTGAKTDGTITGEAFPLKAFNASKSTEEVGLVVSGE